MLVQLMIGGKQTPHGAPTAKQLCKSGLPLMMQLAHEVTGQVHVQK